MFIVTFFLINKDSDELAKEEGVQIPKSDYESESKNQMEKLERKEKEDEVNNESAKKEKEDIKIKKTKPVIGKKEKDEKKTKSKILSPRETIVELHKGLKKINSKSLIVFESTLKNVKQNYNSEKMLSMIIGNQWKNVSNEKRKEIINVFEEYIAKNYVRRFNKMKDFSFVENKEQNVGKFVMVRSNLVIGKEEKVSISYLLSNDKNVWKIFDVLLAGSVSEIATKKSEFRSFIKGRNIDPLIDALKKKNKDLI
jgi:phospholipid transport system substrate-binding protein